ncbi:uncharacterized protein BT62DRAFT_943297 [Guyanagaster necrorhizus]|uniref:EamA domain-containing protein n=1 Tax=Guyanagaster necrorhizus TaxID=856835 RepID=A0A9P8AXY0_9AGAR|nr:uncharacterized protein BT62DRAFT_943297 [Guyanagaster necrorhizus MCA 3950]KAG7450397.1 hypothetical protein BT62DRAFT_943297 [Guyanagaster necrorhizus MCA 3950]
MEEPAPPQLSAHSRSQSQSHRILISKKSPLNNKDYTAGIALLLVVVLLWTFSNFITQDMFEGGYEKPFLVTYLNTSSFSLYLLPFLLRRAWDYYRNSKRHIMHSTPGYEALPGEAEVDSEVINPNLGEIMPSHDTRPLTTQETAKLASLFCSLWFIANWAVNASLDYTSVASATILSSMSGFFTLGIGRMFNVETLTFKKVCAVLTSFAGVLLVSASDSSQSVASDEISPHAILGDTLALTSAVFYALYVILLKVRIKSESRIDMQLFFGFVGLFNTLAYWPIGILLHVAGVEKLELPSSSRAVTILLVNMAITWSSDYLYVLAMLRTTPLVVTIGLSLTIPLAVIGDLFLGNFVGAKVMFGAIMVFVGFLIVGTDRNNTDEEHILLEETADEE